MKLRLLIFISMLLSYRAVGQCPALSFSAKDSVCIEEVFTITNQSNGTENYQWDFCLDELITTPTQESLNPGSLDFPVNITVVQESGNYYGFVASRYTSSIIRLDFGNTLTNVPAVTDLGSLGILSHPRRITLQKVSGQWYGFVTDFSLNTLVRLDFGTAINNSIPSVTNLGDLGLLNRPTDLVMLPEGNDWYGFIPNFSGNTLVKVHWQDSLTASPTASGISVTGGNLLSGVDVFRTCDDIWLWVSSFSSNQVFTLNFVSGLANGPTQNEVVDPASSLSFISPTGIKIVPEGDSLTVFVQEFGNNLKRVRSGLAPGTVAAMGNISGVESSGSHWGIDVVYDSIQGQWIGLSTNTSTDALDRLIFPAGCGGNSPWANSGFEPDSILFASAEIRPFALSTTTEGKYSVLMDTVVITSDVAPSISFTSGANECVADSIVLKGESDTPISQWYWSVASDTLGQGDALNWLPDSASEYTVRLSASSISGCTNHFDSTISVYPEPIADFAIVSSQFCTGQLISFHNNSNLTDADFITWYIDTLDTLSVADASYTFPSAGSYIISLVVSVPGCTDSLAKGFELESGPVLDFSVSNNCPGANVEFLPTFDGVDSATVVWDFGDGFGTSTEIAPSYAYVSSDTYPVTISASSPAGCIGSHQDSIFIPAASMFSFSNSNIIENIPFTGVFMEQLGTGDMVASYSSYLLEDTLKGNTWEYTLPVPDTISVTTHLKTAFGCVDTLVSTLIVHDAPFPTANIIFADSLCREEYSWIEGAGVNYTSAQWNFCPGGIKGVAEGAPLGLLKPDFPVNIRLARQGSSYFGFVLNRNTGGVVRVTFQDSLHADPVELDLGNFGVLSHPRDIQVIQDEDGHWHGFLLDFAQSTLYHLVFGEDLANPTPHIEAVSTSGLASPTGIEMVKIRGIWHAWISNFASAALVHTRFDAGLNEAPLVSKEFLPSTQNGAVSLVVTRDTVTAWVTAFDRDRVYQVSYHDSTLSAHNQEVLQYNGAAMQMTDPTGIATVPQGDSVIVFVQGFSSDLLRFTVMRGSNSVGRVDTVPKFAEGNHWGVTIWPDEASGNYTGFVVNTSFDDLERFSFSSSCDLGTPVFQSGDEANVKFQRSGTYSFVVELSDEHGFTNYQRKELVIRDEEAPRFTYHVDSGRCILTPNIWTAQSDQILQYKWIVGSDTLPGDTLVYSPNTAGTYTIKLAAEAVNGCSNRSIDSVNLFAPPSAAFDVSASLLCEGQTIKVANVTQYSAPDSLMEWQWQWSGQKSYERDLSLVIPDPETIELRLVAQQPGCADTVSKVLDVEATPISAFSADSVCLGEPMFFQNQSTGLDTLIYVWDFGDGYSTISSEPKHQYEEVGSYPVKLRVMAANGCSDSLIQEVEVHAIPRASFAHEPTCEGGSTLFLDGSTVANANIENWHWKMRLASEEKAFETIAYDPNPYLSFEDDSPYEVSLSVTSVYGCTADTVVTIYPSSTITPQFNRTPACWGELVQLEDATPLVGDLIIRNHAWQVAGVSYSGPSVAIPQQDTGTYTLHYTVEYDNGCSATTTAEWDVLPPPTGTLSLPTTCENEQALLSVISSDSRLVNVRWETPNGVSVTGAQLVFTPQEFGDHYVRATLADDLGCTTQLSDTLKVLAAPEAQMNLSGEKAGVPFTVQFLAYPQNMAQYYWYFGETSGAKASGDSVSFTYQKEGIYFPTVVVENSEGCRDTVSQRITAVAPLLDVALVDLRGVPTEEGGSAGVTVTNTGSLVPDSLVLHIQYGVQRIQYIYKEPLPVGERRTINLPINFDAQREKSTYCVRIETPNVFGAEEKNLDDNERCLPLVDQLQFRDPYPNPAGENVTIEVVSPVATEVQWVLLAANGSKIAEEQTWALNTGLNRLQIPLDQLMTGVYWIRIKKDLRSFTLPIILHK